MLPYATTFLSDMRLNSGPKPASRDQSSRLPLRASLSTWTNLQVPNDMCCKNIIPQYTANVEGW